MNKDTDEDVIKRYLNGVYTQVEADRVLDIIRRSGQNAVLDQCMRDTWKESQSITSSEEEKRFLMQEASSLLRAGKRKYIIFPRIYLRRAASIAASIAVIAFLSICSYNYFTTISAEEQIFVEQFADYGEIKSFILPDGTQVTLNSRSQIVYPAKFTRDERNVELRGEAYFQVTGNDKMPFIIHTDKFNVKVIGTEFNIKAYEDDILQSVNVEKGKVQVDMQEAMIRLTKTEQLDINTETNDYVKYGETDSVAIWRKGYLQFNKTPINDIVNELERNYNVSFTLEQGKTFDNLITGRLLNTNLVSVLETLEHVSGIHFRYDRTKGEVYLYK